MTEFPVMYFFLDCELQMLKEEIKGKLCDSIEI